MTLTPPQTSRLLDCKQENYDNRQISVKRAISYAQINKAEGGKGGDGYV